MVSWFKRPGDSKIPSTRAKLVARYLMTCNRMEHERDRKKPDEDAVVEDANEAAAVWNNVKNSDKCCCCWLLVVVSQLLPGIVGLLCTAFMIMMSWLISAINFSSLDRSLGTVIWASSSILSSSLTNLIWVMMDSKESIMRANCLWQSRWNCSIL